MNPVFTIPYPEFVVASQLGLYLKPSQGYALFVPASRQEKGVDLLVTYRNNHTTRAMSVQVKSSRTYAPKTAKPRKRKLFRFNTWYNTFEAPPEADFVFLVALYPNEKARVVHGIDSWWSQLIMAFTHKEMREFLASVKTRAGKPDKMFGFGFDSPDHIEQSRGDQHRRYLDFTSHLLFRKIDEIKRFLGEARPTEQV